LCRIPHAGSRSRSENLASIGLSIKLKEFGDSYCHQIRGLPPLKVASVAPTARMIVVNAK
jgi:hypothetical protein